MISDDQHKDKFLSITRILANIIHIFSVKKLFSGDNFQNLVSLTNSLLTITSTEAIQNGLKVIKLVIKDTAIKKLML